MTATYCPPPAASSWPRSSIFFQREMFQPQDSKRWLQIKWRHNKSFLLITLERLPPLVPAWGKTVPTHTRVRTCARYTTPPPPPPRENCGQSSQKDPRKSDVGLRNSEGSQEGSLGALSPGVQGLLPSHRTGACLWVQSLSFKVNKLHNHNGKNAIY